MMKRTNIAKKPVIEPVKLAPIKKMKSTDKSITSPYIKRQLKRREADDPGRRLNQRKEFSREHLKRTAHVHGATGEPVPDNGERKASSRVAGVDGLQPIVSVSDPSSAGRVDDDGATRKQKARMAVLKNIGTVIGPSGSDAHVSSGSDAGRGDSEEGADQPTESGRVPTIPGYI